MNGEENPIIDSEVLVVLREAIGDTVNDIIALYLDDVPKSLQHMFKSAEESDFVTVGRLAHSLKSSSANLGAMRTSNLAADIESAIKDGFNDQDKILKDIQNLQQSFDQSAPLFRDCLK
jgi:HPt (histidine-containing phosphotransfer) domain-containing protein